MTVSEDQFCKLREQCGDQSSWAVWNGADDRGRFKCPLDILDPTINRDLISSLNNNYIFLGLNISKPIEKPLANFHPMAWKHENNRLDLVLRGTKFWGSYMTDLVRQVVKANGADLQRRIRQDPKLLVDGIKALKADIEILRMDKPIIFALGAICHNQLTSKDLPSSWRIHRLTHYAARMGTNNYVARVQNELATAGV